MITTGQTLIGQTPTLIDGREVNPFRLQIRNMDSTQSVFIGGANVTTSNGFGVEKLEAIELIINPLEELYAVSDKTGHRISWIKQTEV